ncbi:cupin domain-containing protein [Microbacterium jejuense]|uniref:Cupin domain-containing protein n=1 Tax=Microbacterium jejuense TaxID=1263637 RepID=A0ABS7HI17_9MICO|nr:cupin domain-containing protein [Microbacterium jejuense]MBW9092144.1 cupin domain-containing protein [Microbacterium jejuense]
MNTATPAIVPATELGIGTGRTRRFIGAEHDAAVSYFFVDNEPGQGPDLHRHPYAETWVVLDGEARITIGDVVLHAVAGDTATGPANVWHGFKNSGTGRLRVLCIHASDRIIQEWQDAPGVLDIPSSSN